VVDIAWQAPTWSGGSNTTQHIQSVVDANPAGTTYHLLSGVHRGQTVVLKAGDTFIFDQGAVMSGAQDVSGGWTQDGTYPNLYFKAGFTRYQTSDFGGGQNGACRTGYACGDLDCMLVDGQIKAWRTTIGAVGPDDAYYSGGTVWIYGNPAGKLVEIARTSRAFIGPATGVTVRSNDPSFMGEIYGYASDAQDERAAFAGGRSTSWPHDPVGAWTVQDIWLHSCSGFGLACSNNSTYKRMLITDMGQMGHGGAVGMAFEYNDVRNNGVTGWDPGWEGGNNKIANVAGFHVVRGSYFAYDSTNPNLSMTSVLWWDIDNDGAYAEDCMLVDTEAGTYRGLFFEISLSAWFHRIIAWGLARDAENGGWAKGIFSSESGPDGGDYYPTIQISECHLYRCGGGPGGVENGPREHKVENMNIHHNIVYFDGGLPWTQQSGIVDWNASYTPDNCDFDFNIYFVPSITAGHWENSVVGGSGVLNWGGWQADGQDPNGVAKATSLHPSTVPDPFSGGAL